MRTPLYDTHVRLNGRIVDFHGWELPVWYTGIMEEHLAVRTAAGIFDVSHMGEIRISGADAVAYLNGLTTIDVGTMETGQAKYTFLLNEQGGIIDDLLVYCVKPDEYLLCVNASNREHDLAWLKAHVMAKVAIADESAQTAMLAVQGPAAARILEATLAFDLTGMRRYHFTVRESRFGRLMLSRTGYTGEDGVEIFLANAEAPALWETLVEAGAVPCGLGARDTLRLEMGYPLHGNDIDTTTTPLEAGLGFALDMHKPDFLGKNRLQGQREAGLARRLTGLSLLEKGVPRQGYPCERGGQVVGRITSGSISPVLQVGIALAYLDAGVKAGDEIEIMIRSKAIRARVVKPPFVQTALTK